MARVLVFLANGFEEIEAITQVDVLRRAGVDVKTVSMNDDLMVTGFFNVPVSADMSFSEINTEEVEMLVLPGGLTGMKNLSAHQALKDLLFEFHQREKWLAAICASPKIFGELGLLKNKAATCYPGFESTLTEAVFVEDEVIVDGKIITSRGPGTSAKFALKLVEVLCGEEKSNDIKNKMLIK